MIMKAELFHLWVATATGPVPLGILIACQILYKGLRVYVPCDRQEAGAVSLIFRAENAKKLYLVQGTQQLVKGRLLLGWWGLPPSSRTPPFENPCQTSQQTSTAEGIGQACVKYYISILLLQRHHQVVVKCILI